MVLENLKFKIFLLLENENVYILSQNKWSWWLTERSIFW